MLFFCVKAQRHSAAHDDRLQPAAHLKTPAAPTAWPVCAAASRALSSSKSRALRWSLGSMRCLDSHLLAALPCRCTHTD